MAKIFTKLNIGDTVATSGTRVFKKLTTEQSKAGGYLTFSSPSAFTLSTISAKKTWDGILEYSTNADTWDEWDGATTLSADSGVLHMRGTGNTKITGGSNGKWVLNGMDISCEGNVENLLDCATVASGKHPSMAEYCYHSMFDGCTSLKTAPELLATTLTRYCCHSMFRGCTSLKTAPELPATSLADGCYVRMFDGCTSLTMTPKLPATNLVSACYNAMFRGCTSLKTVPELLATSLEEYCYSSMFYGCTAIKLSTTKTGEYQTPYRIPTSGTGTSVYNSVTDMFANTGGTFTGTPTINTTYYTSNEVV